ncbi:hypothetical protein QUC31_008538 [Theobroma cacao]|uniref:Uncharacterized protein n=1 Tax=Theobroma cacao TaxID=3641 RepID=A0A061G340_THECC|nr:Uncharacterized protein TCM_015716 [Theobroma cacao]WRX17120.1 hypothetical protein QQP08_009607 [Theobroma cacao]
MSLNCLTCQVLQRTDSNKDRDYGKEKDSRKFCCIRVDRSWSGNLSPAAYEQIRNEPMPVPTRKGHRRLNTIDTTFGAVAFEADGEPRLVRSCGMRRDWSFEDLRGTRDEKMRKEMRVR